MMKVEVNKPKVEFHIFSKGNSSFYYEKENGVWLLKKVWVKVKKS